MCDELDFASLTEIRIDPSGPVLRLCYSIPDQGGAQLLYEFALPCDSSQNATLKTRYSHEPHQAFDSVALRELLGRLVSDARHWLEEQLPPAEHEGKRELLEALQRVQATLAQAAA